MKSKINKYSILILLAILVYGCFNKKEQITSIDYEPYIEGVIQKCMDKGEVKPNPLIVLNGVPYKHDILIKEERLKHFNDTIKSYIALPYESGTALYGDRAKNGVIIVSSKKYMEQ